MSSKDWATPALNAPPSTKRNEVKGSPPTSKVSSGFESPGGLGVLACTPSPAEEGLWAPGLCSHAKWSEQEGLASPFWEESYSIDNGTK